MAKSVATLAVSVKARTSDFLKKMKKSRRAMRQFGKIVKVAARRVALFGAALATAAAAGIALYVRQSLQAIDVTAKVSDKLGIATEALEGLRFAAKLSGVEISTFDMGLQRFVRRIAEAGQLTGEAKAAIKELGLVATDFVKLAPEEQMYAIADAMENVALQGDRVRLGMKLFDSEGVALINTLSGGSQKLREMQKEARRLGITFTRDAAAKVEKANDAITKFKLSLRGAANLIAIAVSPKIKEMADRLTEWVVELNLAETGAGRLNDVLEKMAELLDKVSTATRGFDAEIKGIKLLGLAALNLAAKTTLGEAGLGLFGIDAKAIQQVRDEAYQNWIDAFNKLGFERTPGDFLRNLKVDEPGPARAQTPSGGARELAIQRVLESIERNTRSPRSIIPAVLGRTWQ